MQNKAFQFDSIVLDNQLKHLLLQRLQKCGALFQVRRKMMRQRDQARQRGDNDDNSSLLVII